MSDVNFSMSIVDWPDMVFNASRQPYQNASFCGLRYTLDVEMKNEHELVEQKKCQDF